MDELAPGLIYLSDLNKLVYSNSYIINSGSKLSSISNDLGTYAEYISDDDRDLLYAKSIGVKVFNEIVNEFDYSLINDIDTDREIDKLKKQFSELSDLIEDEYDYIKLSAHNILLLKMAFILKKHLDSLNTSVYLMRGSGVSSFIFYLIGLNKVNPIKFGLDYKNFWNN